MKNRQRKIMEKSQAYGRKKSLAICAVIMAVLLLFLYISAGWNMLPADGADAKSFRHIPVLCRIQRENGVVIREMEMLLCPDYVGVESLQTGSGTLKRGRFPGRETEIAVEEKLLEQWDKGVTVGGNIMIIFPDGRTETFIISGILKNSRRPGGDRGQAEESCRVCLCAGYEGAFSDYMDDSVGSRVKESLRKTGARVRQKVMDGFRIREGEY